MNTDGWMQKIVSKIETLGDNELERYVLIKKIQSGLDDILKGILLDANHQYLNFPDFELFDCKLARNTGRTEYVYSDEVEELERELKAKKEYEKKKGIAKKTESEIDPAKSPLFKVVVK